MAKARALEERLLKMAKSHDGQFWIGGPGEEGFNVPLGMLIKKGEGLDFDFLHFHYRQSATLLAMGEPLINPMRQMASVASDPYSGGRNFVSHFAKKEWNIMPVHSPIATQYAIALGTAWAQKRHGGTGITIVTGGDAGTAEGDFATCLGWSNMPTRELPLLIIVTNNRFGISTPFAQVHGDETIAKRAEAFGIAWDTLDGNDPEVAYTKLSEVMHYVRHERKPFCLEVSVSRLHGHSSSSGGNRVNDRDCLEEYQAALVAEHIFTQDQCTLLRQGFADEVFESLKIVRTESQPLASSAADHIFAKEAF